MTVAAFCLQIAIKKNSVGVVVVVVAVVAIVAITVVVVEERGEVVEDIAIFKKSKAAVQYVIQFHPCHPRHSQ